MESVEAALKASVRKEMASKPSPQSSAEDFWVVGAQNGASYDDCFVDELLDFSNEEGLADKEGEDAEEGRDDGKKTALSVSPLEADSSAVTFCARDDFGSVPESELAVPADDLESLEWLSHFVEDSFFEYSATPFPAGTFPVEPLKSQPEKTAAAAVVVLQEPCFKTPVPAKARSKRARAGGRVWSLGSPSFVESSSSSPSSSSSSSSYSSPTSPLFLAAEPASGMERQAPKKHKRRVGPHGTATAQAPRRCSHCGVQKTPQWRTGPLGAKTLCNACGVRYKSGRLLPEYRPACSPTFSSELHSNHHRKVLEMRRKKEMEMLGQPESTLAPPPPRAVPSF